ncbi:MAG TPA: alpha/beta fold hydrolase [Candidatus Acidoferrum sp.]|nr:alpha/beta fold hydrolase [Candidatus Acidoferrum sp.]
MAVQLWKHHEARRDHMMQRRLLRLGGLTLALAFVLVLAPLPALLPAQPAYAVLPERPLVVLLHGLNRSKQSMAKMAQALKDGGFDVCNVGYPSSEFTVEVLAHDYVLPSVQQCLGANKQRPVNFVTHSMGGILVRQLRANKEPLHFGRVVMLGTPNAGSEVVDKLGDWVLFQWWNGPAAQELGTGAPLLNKLGPTDLDVGIVAGNHSIDPIFSSMIPGDDDGKVSIEHAKLAGMRDFIVLPVSHPFLMRDDAVISQTINFLQTGKFRHPPP